MIPGLNVNSAVQSDDQYMTPKRLVKENKRENVARFSGGVIIKTTFAQHYCDYMVVFITDINLFIRGRYTEKLRII